MRSSSSRVSDTESAGVVEISNMPRMFYTPSFGAPDMLFCTLLTSAREAYAATASGAVQQQGATSLEPGFYAETYMSGLLLRDQNFVPARVLRNYAHHYILDFGAGVIYLRTELYAVQQQSTSLFSVKLGEHILENTFVVRDVTTDRVLAQVSEEELSKPNFFSRELPFLSYHARVDPGLTASGGTASLVDQDFQLQLGVPLGNGIKSMLVHKDKGDLKVQVRDAETGQSLCFLPLECLNNLGNMAETLRKMVADKALKIAG